MGARTIESKYNQLILKCRVIKYGSLMTGEYKLGGRSMPIMQDRELIRAQLTTLIAWIHEHPGKIFHNSRIHNSYMTGKDIKEMVKNAMRKLPNDASECAHFIKEAEGFHSQVVYRMFVLLISHAILVDESLDSAKDEYTKIANCIKELMDAIVNTTVYHRDLLYSDFTIVLSILGSILCRNEIISWEEYERVTYLQYFESVMKNRIHPNSALDIRSFKRMVDEYIFPVKGAEGTLVYLRMEFFPKHQYLYEIKSYADYIDDLDSYFQF